MAAAIELTEQERQTLTNWTRGWNTPVKLLARAQVIPRAADGIQNNTIGSELGANPCFVQRWRTRFFHPANSGN